MNNPTTTKQPTSEPSACAGPDSSRSTGYVFHYYRYHGLYTEEHDTLNEALESAMSGEDSGSLSSHKITHGDEVVWDRSMGFMFEFAERNGVST
jgi:hypothetical protein